MIERWKEEAKGDKMRAEYLSSAIANKVLAGIFGGG